MKQIASNKMSTKDKIRYAVTALALASAMPLGAFGANITSHQWTGGSNMQSIMGGLIGMVLTIAFWIGVILVIAGVVKAVMAYKDDNTNEITQGVRLAVVGGILVGLTAILQGLGLIG